MKNNSHIPLYIHFLFLTLLGFNLLFAIPAFTFFDGLCKEACLARVETPDDRVLSDQVRNTLASDGITAAASENITVSSVENLVILRGNVKSAQDKNLILMKVRQVPGVTNVQDEIQIKTIK